MLERLLLREPYPNPVPIVVEALPLTATRLERDAKPGSLFDRRLTQTPDRGAVG